METEIREYVASNVMFPKRYKVRAHVYFIMIKTTANTMRDFKEKKAIKPNGGNSGADNPLAKLNMRRDGWYEGTIDFKRVVLIPATGKHEYRDTTYVARCKACSGLDCYNRMVDYLRTRVDNRSQFPSAKGKKFHFKYLGMWKELPQQQA